jgi:hypothetical protein
MDAQSPVLITLITVITQVPYGRGKMSIPSFSDDSSSDDEGEGKPSVDEFAEAVKFF